MAMEIVQPKNLHEAQMLPHIRALLHADLPELSKYQKAWKHFLWARGHELDHQLRQDYTEAQFTERMSHRLKWFEQENPLYTPEFLSALKASLYDIINHYDEHRNSEETPVHSTKANLLPPIAPIESADTFVATIKEDTPPEKNAADYAIQAGGAFVRATLSCIFWSSAYIVYDVETRGYDNSLAKRVTEAFHSAPKL